jgi:hypothetical protein
MAKFSLIVVFAQRGDLVEGNWVQNHVGNLESATAKAIRTEEVNDNKIDIAVVAEVSSVCPWLGYWDHLVRLDKRRIPCKVN